MLRTYGKASENVRENRNPRGIRYIIFIKWNRFNRLFFVFFLNFFAIFFRNLWTTAKKNWNWRRSSWSLKYHRFISLRSRSLLGIFEEINDKGLYKYHNSRISGKFTCFHQFLGATKEPPIAFAFPVFFYFFFFCNCFFLFTCKCIPCILELIDIICRYSFNSRKWPLREKKFFLIFCDVILVSAIFFYFFYMIF